MQCGCRPYVQSAAVVATLAASLCSCHVIAPYEATTAAAAGLDAASEAAPVRDGQRDQRPGTDGAASTDALSDRALDAPADVRGAATPDMAGETAPGDSAAPGRACAGGNLPLRIYGPTMAICDGPGRSQCAAHELCNAVEGWRPCTATEYKNRGGAAITNHVAWLASCVRTSASPFSPTDSPCPCSATPLAAAEAVRFDCATLSPVNFTPAGNLGVATHDSCLALGEPLPANKSAWITLLSTSTVTKAVCCLPSP